MSSLAILDLDNGVSGKRKTLDVHRLVVQIVEDGVDDNDNDNELFIQTRSNEKHHKGNTNLHIKKTSLQRSCQRDCTEGIMAASIQPPVIF